MTTTAHLVELHSPTEDRNPATMGIDTLPAAKIVELIIDQDAQVVNAIRIVQAQIGELAERCVEAINAGGRVHYVGAGTSGRLGVLDAVELLPTYNAGSDFFLAHLAGGSEALINAVEGAEDSVDLGRAAIASHASKNDVVVGIAASGRTPYVKGALLEARRRNLGTALLSTNPNAPLAEYVDTAILVNTGPEVVTGSTRMKAATAQKIMLNALSTATMVRLGKTYENLMIDVRATNEKLVARTVRILRQASGADEATALAALEATGRKLRPALVLLLAGAPLGYAEQAAALTAEYHPDPHRKGDASGIRTAVAALRNRLG